MITEHDAFMAAIIEHKAEDWPRLQYADWLEEHGQHDRADLIRVQCELWGKPDCPDWCDGNCRVAALRRREREILAGHDWLPVLLPLPIVTRWVRFFSTSRGFVSAIALSAEDWLKYADALTSATPLEKVTLTTVPPWGYVDSDMLIAYLLDVEPHTELDVFEVPDGADIIKALLEKRWNGIKFNLPATPSGLVSD